MPADRYGARPIIYRNDQKISDSAATQVRTVVVESDLHAPDSCRVVFEDPARSLLKDLGFEFLDKLKIGSAPIGDNEEEAVFDGKVYGLEFQFGEHGAALVVSGFDNSYALYNGFQTKTYSDMTDSDIASQIAKDASVEVGEVQSTSVVHKHIAQVNETHFDFLARRARENGFELRITKGKLYFGEPTKSSEAPSAATAYDGADRLQLTPGGNLEHFASRVTAAQQVSEVEVRGWDVQNKTALVATKSAATRAAALQDDPAALAGKIGSPRRVTIDIPLGTQAECDAAADAEAERIASSFAHAEGTAKGDPRLLAGTAVSVGQTGGRFDGKYTITSARHVFAKTGYRTHFTVTGRHDRTLLGMVSPTSRKDPRPGVVVGLVTNASDPDGLGRVKVKFPWLSDDYESDWARVLQLGAGSDRGFVLLPEVNDEVLVAFEQGDQRRPFVLGGVFNGVDKPAYNDAVDTSDGKVKKRALKTRVGHEIVLDDTDGQESIVIRTKDGKVSLTLDHANEKLVIVTEKDVAIHAKGDANIKADQNISVEAGQSLKVKAGTTLSLEGGSDVTIKGSMVKIN